LSTYTGPLYQVRKGGSASGTGGTTTDIGFTTDGYADGAAQDTACGTSACTISKIYDQSGKGNHLTFAPAGGAKTTPDNEADAKARSITINGHKVYGEDGKTGVGYRNNKPSGTATGDNAETEYAIFDATVFNGGCCFDYGNMETNSRDNGEGTMEAVYWGNCTSWGKGAGSGPWVMGDLENGLWAGNASPYNGNTSITGYKFVTAMLKGDAAGKNHWAIKAGNAQSGTLTKMFDGTRPSSRYNPMRKEGAIGLNTGGDNSNGATGVFFEGVMTAHYSSDAADDAVQVNIVAAGYGKWRSCDSEHCRHLIAHVQHTGNCRESEVMGISWIASRRASARRPEIAPMEELRQSCCLATFNCPSSTRATLTRATGLPEPRRIRPGRTGTSSHRWERGCDLSRARTNGEDARTSIRSS
jgi:hypothetical protein